ncbi:MAG TPA: hypothetical protein VF095_09515 [Bacillota bacterium]
MKTPWINHQTMRDIISKEITERIFVAPNFNEWMTFKLETCNHTLFLYEYGVFRVEHLLIREKLKYLLLFIEYFKNEVNDDSNTKQPFEKKKQKTISYRDVVCYQMSRMKKKRATKSESCHQRSASTIPSKKQNRSTFLTSSTSVSEQGAQGTKYEQANKKTQKDRLSKDSMEAYSMQSVAKGTTEELIDMNKNIDHLLEHSNDPFGKKDVSSQAEKNNEEQMKSEITYDQASSNIQVIQEKIPISIYVDVKQFMHPPVIGSMKKYMYKFLERINAFSPDLQTKLFEQINVYTNPPYCELAESKIYHLSSHLRKHSECREKNSNLQRATVGAIFPSKKEKPVGNYTIKLPVVIGTYEIEVVLKNDIPIAEPVLEIKQIDHEIIVTKSEFVPTKLSSFKKGKSVAKEGKLFLYGFLLQKIDYLSECNQEIKDTSSLQSSWLQQNIVLNMTVDLLQHQQIII